MSIVRRSDCGGQVGHWGQAGLEAKEALKRRPRLYRGAKAAASLAKTALGRRRQHEGWGRFLLRMLSGLFREAIFRRDEFLFFSFPADRQEAEPDPVVPAG